MRGFFALLILVFVAQVTIAQDAYPERARAYVKQYAEYAIADQRSTGVPAAITLGQGILETEAGLSELMVKANNHFGVKCKNNWQGETFLHTDDAKDECFKKYGCAQDSYHDHSAHLLKNPRYSSLFTYSPTDYAKWSHGLKKCGYATNPKYGYQLIKIIEEYRLQEYTYAALDSNYKLSNNCPTVTTAQDKKQVVTQQIVPTTAVIVDTAVVTATVAPSTGFDAIAHTADSIRAAAAIAKTESVEVQDDNGKIVSVNGLKAIYAHKDDALLPYAIKYKVRYAHLLEMNDLPDEPLAFDTYIYLEKKHATGLKSKHAVKEGETLLMVAQEEGVQLKKLAAFNMMTPAEVPVTGTALYLQETASVKPNIKAGAIKVYDGGALAQAGDTQDDMPETKATNTSTEEIGYGMGFEAPKERKVAVDKPVTATEEPAVKGAPQPTLQQPQRPADTARNNTTGIVKQPFMREDPPQPQLKKPATEPEYKDGDKHYLVKRGETAFSIAKKHNITVGQLLKLNRMEATDLKAGQTLVVRE